jgi:hypothetical protein
MDGRLSAWRPAVIHELVSQCCCSPQVPMQHGISYCRLTGLGLAALHPLHQRRHPKRLAIGSQAKSLSPFYSQLYNLQPDIVYILALSTSTFIHHDTQFDDIDRRPSRIFSRYRSQRHECIGTPNTFNNTHQALHSPKHRDDLLPTPTRSESSCLAKSSKRQLRPREPH